MILTMIMPPLWSMVDSAHCGDRRKSASCMSGWLAIHTSQVFAEVYMYMLVFCTTWCHFTIVNYQNALLCSFVFKLGYPKVWITKATICTRSKKRTLTGTGQVKWCNPAIGLWTFLLHILVQQYNMEYQLCSWTEAGVN